MLEGQWILCPKKIIVVWPYLKGMSDNYVRCTNRQTEEILEFLPLKLLFFCWIFKVLQQLFIIKSQHLPKFTAGNPLKQQFQIFFLMNSVPNNESTFVNQFFIYGPLSQCSAAISLSQNMINKQYISLLNTLLAFPD